MPRTHVTGWSGRTDDEDGEAGLRWHQIVRPWSASLKSGVTVVGFCSDEGVRLNHGRVGAANGPSALRSMLSNLPAEPGLVLNDAGNVIYPPSELASGQQSYSKCVASLLRDDQFVVGLGGGHEIAWGTFSGFMKCAQASVNSKIGILNLDAHFDLRKASTPHSGTSFAQALDYARRIGRHVEYKVLGISEAANTQALFHYAREYGATWRHDHEMTLLHLNELIAELEAWISELDHLFLSICLDVLPASVAPGVSAPAARGVSMEVLEPIIWTVAESGKLRLADVAELNPRLDIDNRTARAAARLIWRIVHSHLEAKRAA